MTIITVRNAAGDVVGTGQAAEDGSVSVVFRSLDSDYSSTMSFPGMAELEAICAAVMLTVHTGA